jgi:hypothetical protein
MKGSILQWLIWIMQQKSKSFQQNPSVFPSVRLLDYYLLCKITQPSHFHGWMEQQNNAVFRFLYYSFKITVCKNVCDDWLIAKVTPYSIKTTTRLNFLCVDFFNKMRKLIKILKLEDWGGFDHFSLLGFSFRLYVWLCHWLILTLSYHHITGKKK